MTMDRLCYLGRASVENEQEANAFINKVLSYEKMTNANTSYLMNHLAVSAYITKESTGKLTNGGQEAIDGYLSSYSQVHKWYLFDHYNCDCSFHNPTKKFDCGEELNREHFLSALQDGGNSGLGHFHIIYHMDHCNPRNMP